LVFCSERAGGDL